MIKPSTAVLPFQNMSGDPEQEYFADGTVEEIITALSRIRWLFVIARNSTFTYKGQRVDVQPSAAVQVQQAISEHNSGVVAARRALVREKAAQRWRRHCSERMQASMRIKCSRRACGNFRSGAIATKAGISSLPSRGIWRPTFQPSARCCRRPI
jgi:hypothetical protein